MTKAEKLHMHLYNINSAIKFLEEEYSSGVRDSDDLDWILNKVTYREDIDEVVVDFKENKLDRSVLNE